MAVVAIATSVGAFHNLVSINLHGNAQLNAFHLVVGVKWRKINFGLLRRELQTMQRAKAAEVRLLHVIA